MAGRQTGGQAARGPLWLTLAPGIFLLLWCGGFTFAKLGLAHAAPLTFLALRYAIVLALLLPAFLLLRPRLPSTPAAWAHLAAIGVLIQALYFGLSYAAFHLQLSAGTVALIVSLQPVLVAILAPRFVGESVSARRWLGLMLGLAGAAAVIAARSAVELTSMLGVAAAAGALAAITAGTLYEKRFGCAHHPVTANLVQYLVGLAAIAPGALWLEDLRVDWTGELLVSLAYLVVANSLISVSLLLAMIRHGEAARVSTLFFLVPPGAALLAWLVLGETMTAPAWAGMAVAAVGVAIAVRPGAGKRAR